MALRCAAFVAFLTLRVALAADNATCDGKACEDVGMMQINEGWGCAEEHSDPYRNGRHGRCCHGLTKVQGQFESERCTHQCFACTGRNGNKDPYSQCGGACDQGKCEVPCCAGTYKVKGYWNSGKCSYQCTCAGYGQDTYQYCAGGNPCGGDCHVPCCYPLSEVTEGGRQVCRHWGEIMAQARWAAATAKVTAEDAERAAAAASDAEAEGPAGEEPERTAAARKGATARAAELRAAAIAAAEAAERVAAGGPPKDPMAASVDAAADGGPAETMESGTEA